MGRSGGAEGRSGGAGEDAAELRGTQGKWTAVEPQGESATPFSPAPLPLRTPASEKGLTAREAAQVLGYDNFMTVYNKVHQGTIKVRRRGRNIRIWREDNEELFRARCA